MEFSRTMDIMDNLRPMYPHTREGILGGTFNPVHNGHIDMALKVLGEFDLKKVTLMPTGTPPHKRGHTWMASGAQRMRMAALAIADEQRLALSGMEVEREGYTYTVDTMRELNSKFQETDFYFIIGSDSLFEIEMWKDFSELARLTRFICVRRPEHEPLDVLAEAARLEEKYNVFIEISKYDGLYVSSSHIRERMAQGKSISRFVPAQVEEYIIACGLYK